MGQASGLMVQGSSFRVQNIQDLGVSTFGFRIVGFGFRVSGS